MQFTLADQMRMWLAQQKNPTSRPFRSSPVEPAQESPMPTQPPEPHEELVAAEMRFHAEQLQEGRELYENRKIPETSAELQNYNLYIQEAGIELPPEPHAELAPQPEPDPQMQPGGSQFDASGMGAGDLSEPAPEDNPFDPMMMLKPLI